ncbi:MAG: YceI family protein [bacterium]|nr:YceI family protein [bacterium]
MRTLRPLPTTGLLSAAGLLAAATFVFTSTAPGTEPVPAVDRDATEWAIDGAHSSVVFRVKHMDVAYFYGRFNSIAGDVAIDAEPSKSTVRLAIDADSVDSNSEDRDKHLRNSDFLDAVQFPKITFQSTAVKLKDEKARVYAVTGNLKLHGVEKEVTIDMTMTGDKETRRGHKGGFAGELVINRRDYDITTYGTDAISDEITLYFGLEVNKK